MLNRYLRLVMLLVPVLILAQPFQPQVIWDRSGPTDNSWYGRQILAIGDQNGDGYADWAVNTGFGRSLEFYHGNAALPAEPYHTFHLDTAVYVGLGAESIGDVNGDGYKDWLLTETRSVGYDASVFLGGPLISDTPRAVFYRPDNIRIRSFAGVYGTGSGDFNGDGFSDLFEYNYNADVARVFYGGSPMDTLPDWTLHRPPPGLDQSVPYATGDFNGDGASDFMCFNMNNGNLAVFTGGANPDTVPAYFWSNMFQPKGGIDSLNGDGFAEFLTGSRVHFGRPTLSPVPDAYLNSTAGSYAVDAGDFNGDGYHDLILYTWSTLTNPFGAMDLHLGAAWLNPDPVFTIEGATPPYYLNGIYTAVGLGDVNGDGLGDIAIGVWNQTFWRRGRCVILGGDTLLVAADGARPELPTALDVSVYPNPFNTETEIQIVAPGTVRTVELTVYNILGKAVRRADFPLHGGQFTYHLSADGLGTGIYFVRVEAGKGKVTQKVMLLK